MKGILKYNLKYLILYFVLISLLFLFACGGVTPSGPAISSFTATSTSITEGESITLNWVTDATSVSIDQGIGAVTAPSSSVSVSPAETTTYTLTATNSEGSSTSSITIIVLPDDTTPTTPPAIVSFTATSTSITLGGNVTLSWETTGANKVFLYFAGTYTAGGGTVDFSGAKIVSPSETTTYTLEAINSAGSVKGTITIIVKPIHNLTQDTYYATIQEAIDASTPDDEIVVSPGIYYENIVFDNKDITLRSTDPSDSDVVDNTIIDGNDIDSVVRFTHHDSSTLEGFTIRNGYTSYGGGIYVSSSSPRIISNTITENRAFLWGGGIQINSSSPTITNNIISDNIAEFGAGIRVYLESSPTITDNIISNNGALKSGGGIYSSIGSPIIQGNTIMDNWAYEGGGGGIFASSGTPTIGGTNSSDAGHFNTICGNSSEQIHPDNYPNNYICEDCPCP